MGLWIAIAITLAVLGSILWVKPSPRDKAITSMRSRALANGLKVRLLDQKLSAALFPWVDNYRLYTLYEAQLPTHAKPSSSKALVVRLHYDDDVHELDRIDEFKSALDKSGVLVNIPSTAEALVISASGIALLWQEDLKAGDDQVDLIKELLERCVAQSNLWR